MQAISTSNVVLTAHERLAEERGGALLDVLRVADVIIEPEGQPAGSRKIGALFGIGAIPEHDGIATYPTVTPDVAAAIEMTYTGYALRVRMPRRRAEEAAASYGPWIAYQLYREAWQTLTAIAELDLLLGFSTAMYGGGATLFSTTHPTLSSEGVAGTRSNRITDPLDATGLWEMQAEQDAWKTYGGTLDPQPTGGYLITGPALRRAVAEATGYQLGGSTGNAQQANLGDSLGYSEHIVMHAWGATEDNWIAGRPPMPRSSPDEPNSNPFRIWIREVPMMPDPAGRKDADTGQVDWVIEFAFGVARGPAPGHYFGGIPA